MQYKNSLIYEESVAVVKVQFQEELSDMTCYHKKGLGYWEWKLFR